MTLTKCLQAIILQYDMSTTEDINLKCVKSRVDYVQCNNVLFQSSQSGLLLDNVIRAFFALFNTKNC